MVGLKINDKLECYTHLIQPIKYALTDWVIDSHFICFWAIFILQKCALKECKFVLYRIVVIFESPHSDWIIFNPFWSQVGILFYSLFQFSADQNWRNKKRSMVPKELRPSQTQRRWSGESGRCPCCFWGHWGKFISFFFLLFFCAVSVMLVLTIFLLELLTICMH